MKSSREASFLQSTARNTPQIIEAQQAAMNANLSTLAKIRQHPASADSHNAHIDASLEA